MNRMNGSRYTLPQKIAGRRDFTIYGALNSFSFLLLSGNIITLYVLRLGGSPTFIGIISSFAYLSFFFMLPGKQLVRKYGIVRIFGLGWIIRYLLVIPILITPFIVAKVNPVLSFGIILFSLLGFQIFRGLGLVGQSPLVGELSAGKDRGTYLSRFQIIANSASILSGLCIALLLNPSAPLSRYSLLILSGIVLGLAGSFYILRLPEPPGVQEGAGESFLAAAWTVLKRPNYRRYIIVFGVYCFITGMMRSFMVVYAKQVYLTPDNLAILLSVIGNLGAIFMGLVMRQLMDRLGAKPLYLIFAVIFVFSMVPALISPQMGPVTAVIGLGALFFLTSFGSTGGENASQQYFYAMIQPGEQLNLGILYFVTMGFGGAVGSTAGGVVLEALQSAGGLDIRMAFRIFFALLIVILLIVIAMMSGLKRLGSSSVSNALSVMFSIRDLRAINLLNRLDRTGSIGEEQQVIKELGGAQSQMPADDLLARILSPSYVIRSEALHALERLPHERQLRRNTVFERKISDALVAHLRQHEFTTAYIAARIIGQWKLAEGAPALRESLSSEDYLLAARSMVALARLGDVQSIPRIELTVRATRNPLVLIHGAESLKLFDHRPSVTLLLEILRREENAPYIRDEMIFAMAGLFQIEDWFYPHYRLFLEARSDAISVLEEEAKRAEPQEPAREVVRALTLIEENKRESALLLAGVLASLDGDILPEVPNDVLIHALNDPRLYRYERVLFFMGALLIFRLGRGPNENRMTPGESLAP